MAYTRCCKCKKKSRWYDIGTGYEFCDEHFRKIYGKHKELQMECAKNTEQANQPDSGE